MFSNRQQSIPKVFIDKMEVDSKIEEILRKKKVVNMEEISDLIKKQRYLREDCARAVRKKDDILPGASL